MKIGFAKETITPAAMYRMAGFARRLTKADGKLHELYASCTAMISDAGERAVFCVLDVLGVEREMSQRISEAVEADSVWVSATHTHSAPSAIFTRGIYADPEYHAFVTEQCKKAAQKALETAVEAKVSGTLTSVAGIASVRNSGRDASAFQMPLLVLRFDTAGEPVLLTRFQCHPTVLDERNSRYSGDFVSCARALLPQNTLLMNGACADLSTRYTRKASTPEEAERIGAILADAVRNAHLEPDEDFGRNVTIRKRTLTLERGAGLQGEERERLTRYFTEKSAACADENEKREYDSILCVLTGKQKDAEPARMITLTVADFGTAAFAGLPFEVRHGDALRFERELTEMTGKPVYVTAYTGGYDGYLAGGGKLCETSTYEDFESRYPPETAGILLQALKEMIRGE